MTALAKQRNLEISYARVGSLGLFTYGRTCVFISKVYLPPDRGGVYIEGVFAS